VITTQGLDHCAVLLLSLPGLPGRRLVRRDEPSEIFTWDFSEGFACGLPCLLWVSVETRGISQHFDGTAYTLPM